MQCAYSYSSFLEESDRENAENTQRSQKLLKSHFNYYILRCHNLPCGPAMLFRRKSSAVSGGSPDFLAKSLVILTIYTKFKLKFVCEKLEFHICIWLELPMI